MVHRRAAGGSREDGPAARRDPAVRGEEPDHGRGVPDPHREGLIVVREPPDGAGQCFITRAGSYGVCPLKMSGRNMPVTFSRPAAPFSVRKIAWSSSV